MIATFLEDLQLSFFGMIWTASVCVIRSPIEPEVKGLGYLLVRCFPFFQAKFHNTALWSQMACLFLSSFMTSTGFGAHAAQVLDQIITCHIFVRSNFVPTRLPFFFFFKSFRKKDNVWLFIKSKQTTDTVGLRTTVRCITDIGHQRYLNFFTFLTSINNITLFNLRFPIEKSVRHAEFLFL